MASFTHQKIPVSDAISTKPNFSSGIKSDVMMPSELSCGTQRSKFPISGGEALSADLSKEYMRRTIAKIESVKTLYIDFYIQKLALENAESTGQKTLDLMTAFDQLDFVKYTQVLSINNSPFAQIDPASEEGGQIFHDLQLYFKERLAYFYAVEAESFFAQHGQLLSKDASDQNSEKLSVTDDSAKSDQSTVHDLNKSIAKMNKRQTIMYRFDQYAPQIQFYFSLYDKTFTDPAKPFSPEDFLDLADSVSEGSAIFLKHRNDRDMHLYLQILWQKRANSVDALS